MSAARSAQSARRLDGGALGAEGAQSAPTSARGVRGGSARTLTLRERQWAWRLRDRELAGARLTITQKAMWRAAIAAPIDAA